jgi:hypothetical protein
MWQESIVEETRQLRRQYASKLNNDPDTIFEDILKRQKISKKKMVSFPPRKPESGVNHGCWLQRYLFKCCRAKGVRKSFFRIIPKRC